MKTYFIASTGFSEFVERLIKAKKVIGPVAKKNKFVFSQLHSAEELRLDYDVTILPPKKEFFPTQQPLLTFTKGTFAGCIQPEEKILFGVHFYDIKGIDMTDYLFRERNVDWNYMANREATMVVGSNIQKVSKRAFWASVGKEVEPKGHDAFLTKIAAGYLLEVRSAKGETLLSYGDFNRATESQIEEGKNVNSSVMDQCPEQLNYDSESIAKKVRESFHNEALWEELAKNCFSCGSCNIVCPTCYCFNVEDQWNLDQVSGARNRYWDACLTEDFAKVSLGEGATENFRDSRGERFRHRIMRKAAYLNEKLGGPACTGCGRCSAACTADIADPVNVINKIMEA